MIEKLEVAFIIGSCLVAMGTCAVLGAYMIVSTMV